jgi:hypothetical protein
MHGKLVADGVIAVVAPLFIGVFGAQSINAQSEPAGHMAFAAASIHENKKPKGDMNFLFLPGGKFTGRRMTLASLVSAADMAVRLGPWADRPVIDETGLTGLYKNPDGGLGSDAAFGTDSSGTGRPKPSPFFAVNDQGRSTVVRTITSAA